MRGEVLGSELNGSHLQQPLHQVGDAVVLRWLGVVAEQLSPDDLGSKVR